MLMSEMKMKSVFMAVSMNQIKNYQRFLFYPLKENFPFLSDC